jgi:hypothetical protein
VNTACGNPTRIASTYIAFFSTLLTADRQLLVNLRRVRDEAGVEWLSLLRVLDVAIWMRNYGKKDASSPTLRDAESIKPD